MVWSIIVGLAITALICGGIIACTNKQFSIMSWIVAIIMFLGLSIECNRLIKVLTHRSEISDIVSTIIGSVSGYIDYSDKNSMALV